MIPAEKFKGFKADLTTDMVQELKGAQEEDDLITDLIRNVNNKDNLPATIQKQFRRYSMENGLLRYDERMYVPEDKDLRLELLLRFSV